MPSRRNAFPTEDIEWHMCLSDASALATGPILRRLYITIVAFRPVRRPDLLFDAHKAALSADCNGILIANGVSCPTSTQCTALCAFILHRLFDLCYSGPIASERSGVSPLAAQHQFHLVNIPELHLSPSNASSPATPASGVLRPEQAGIYKVLCNTLNRPDDPRRIFFLHGAPGSGKTFILNALQRYATSLGLGTYALASSAGAAASLRSAQNVQSGVNHLCANEHLGVDAKLILWDDCAMESHDIIDGINEHLQALTHDASAFGGKMVIFAADWRQGSRPDGIQHSTAWASITHLHIAPPEGYTPRENGAFLPMPTFCPNALIEHVYGDLLHHPADAGAHCWRDRIIIAATPAQTALLNSEALSRVSGDSILASATSLHFQHVSMTTAGAAPTISAAPPCGGTPSYCGVAQAAAGCLPAYVLSLKVHAPIALLKDVNPVLGLHSGVRLLVLSSTSHVIMASIISASPADSDQHVFIPRDVFGCDHHRYLQFPARAGFAVQIDAVRGQHFARVGLDVRTPFHGRGSTFAALSRSKAGTGPLILLSDVHGFLADKIQT